MSKPEFDQNDQGNASMFDFLSEDTDGQSIRRAAAKKSQRKVMPTIRKPVPISQSGPLLPPKPGDPVEPPPPLTTGMAKETAVAAGKKTKISDDLDFLDETRAEVPDLRPANDSNSRSAKTSDNVRALHKNAPSEEQQLEEEFRHLETPRKTADEFEFDTDWRAGRTSFDESPDEKSVGWLKLGMLSATALVFVGGSYFAYTGGYLDELLPSSDDSFEQAGDAVAIQATGTTVIGSDSTSTTTDAILPTDLNQDLSAVPVESSTSVRFRTELAAIESLVENGSLVDAEQALVSMDRSVYGYGAVEFSEIETRIALIKTNQTDATAVAEIAEAARVAELQRTEELALAEEAALAEQVRLAENAALAEQARLAEELALAEQVRFADEAALAEQVRLSSEAAQAEQIRLNEETALLAEQAREDARNAVAADVARLEQLRLDAENARKAQTKINEENAAEIVRLEQNRLLQLRERAAARLLESQRLEQAATTAPQSNVATIEAATLIDPTQTTDVAVSNVSSQEQSAAQIAARQADKIRLDALEEAAREEARRQITTADRVATDRQIAEERAAAERRASRQSRLQRAKEIEVQNAAAKTALAALADSGQAGSRPITNDQQNSSPQASSQSLNNTSVSQVQPISDNELQIVYKRFTDLQSAIIDRDISKVVNLTERSGLKVQQFMQMFENSVGIDVRIRNVSTSNATGEINGTLQIKSIERSDGTLVSPPANLKSIKVTTKRQGDDWTVIRW